MPSFQDFCAFAVVAIAPFSVWAYYHLLGGLPL